MQRFRAKAENGALSTRAAAARSITDDCLAPGEPIAEDASAAIVFLAISITSPGMSS
jgi:hypothetical protein